MGYIHTIQLDNEINYLIEPKLFAVAGGTSSALTANISDFVLITGAYVFIKINEVVANATLNVNNTGAKGIYYNSNAIDSNMLTANNIYTFIYDGQYWNIMGDIGGQNVLIGSTLEWQARTNYIAPSGTIIIYTDRGTYTVNNTTVTVPGIKISDGLAYVTDLPFVGDDVAAAIRSELNVHINDSEKHITSTERTFWNNKLNCDISGEVLIFNRS